MPLTFILAEVFEGKGQAGILPLNNADLYLYKYESFKSQRLTHLSKGALSYNTQKLEVLKLDYTTETSQLSNFVSQ